MSDKKKKILLNILMVVAMAVMVIVAVFVVEKKSSDGTTGKTSDRTVSAGTTEETDTAEETDTTEKIDAPEETEKTEKTDAPEEIEKAEKTDTPEEIEKAEKTDTPEEFEKAEKTDTSDEIATTEQPVATEVTETKSCTITIQCTSILENMDKLKEGKADYVPESGYILSAVVEYSEGDTVFDVLTDTCSLYGIQIEYAYTPMYGSYYIEGINHLYEFDCGGTSGWMYSVNGVSPNYGCSAYNVSENDTIVWYYSCGQ